MPALAFVAALTELEKNPSRHRVCLLLTDVAFMQAHLARTLIEGLLPEHRDFNLTRCACTAQTAAAAIEMLGEELPIMAERRLVWVSEVHQLLEPAAARLCAYLPSASPTTFFLLTGLPRASRAAESGDEDEGGEDRGKGSGLRKLTEAVKKHGLVVTATLNEQERSAWLGRELERARVKASAAAMRILVERVGDDLTALATEIEKLSCFVGERARIEVDDVERMVRPTPARRVFDLTDAMARGDASEALLVLSDLLDADEPALRLLAFLATHYRGLIRLKALRESRASVARIAEVTGKKDWLIKRELGVVDRMSRADLEGAIEALIRADQGIKSGKDEATLLQMLVLHLSRAARRPSGSSARAG
jgi:DNA polymerase-3 subunit delta